MLPSMSCAFLFALATVFFALPVQGWHLRQHTSDFLVQQPSTNDNLPEELSELSDDDVTNREAEGITHDNLDEDSDLQDPIIAGADDSMEMSEDVGDVYPDDVTLGGTSDVPVKASVRVVPKVAKLDHLLTQKHAMKGRKKENPIKHIKDALNKAGKIGSRPLMNTINVMRAEFCLRRPDLLEHEKCLKFLLKRCMKETSGYGYCTEFQEILGKACDEGEVLPGEKEKCEYHDELDAKVGPVQEEKPAEPPPPETTTTSTTTVATTTAIASEETERDSQELAVDEGEGVVEMDDGGEDGGDGAPAGAGAAAVSQGPAPAAAGNPAPAPGPVPLPPAHSDVTNFDKKWRELPDQGYDEHSDSEWVQHKDFDTQTEDWRQEWPSWDETEGQSTDRICEERPDHLWCKLWLKDRAHGGEVSRVPTAKHSAASHSSSTKQKKENQRHESVKVKKSARKQQEETQDNLDGGVDATGDQAAQAADELSAALPPGMFPNEDDVEKDSKTKGRGMSESGQDLPPGMLTHPDDVKKDLAFTADKKGGRHETAFGDDDDFVDDSSDVVDVSADDSEDTDEGIDTTNVANGALP